MLRSDPRAVPKDTVRVILVAKTRSFFLTSGQRHTQRFVVRAGPH
jgi:hypothetical protein